MHVLQYLAVDANSKKEAFKNVKNFLEEAAEGSNFWSDWHVVGGGRWSKNSKDGYEDTLEDVISYETDKDKFDKALKWSKNARKDEMRSTLSMLEKNGGEATFIIDALEYIKKADSKSVNMNVYYVHKMAEMLLGNWCSDSFFYDIESRSSSFTYIEEKMNNESEKDSIYLVPVDFHF